MFDFLQMLTNILGIHKDSDTWPDPEAFEISTVSRRKPSSKGSFQYFCEAASRIPCNSELRIATQFGNRL